MPYAELPRVVSTFDVGMIPFRIGPLTVATNPVKVYEMFAAGLPVVGVDLPELRALQPMVSIATSSDEFARAIERSAAEPRSDRVRRVELASEHSWSRRFWQLRAAMDAARPPADRTATAGEVPGPWNDDGSRAVAWLTNDQRLEQSLADVASLRRDRDSLIEQRERVHAEARRLQSELDRVETARLALERAALRRSLLRRLFDR